MPSNKNKGKNVMNEKTVKKRIKLNTFIAIIEELPKEDLTQVLNKFNKNSNNYKKTYYL